ncbi:Pikachurin [Armadillidium vulgare]|nr:Pikachurin [Armadillidium vulgare]
MVTINLGSGPLTLRSLYPIQPGYWHSVSVSRTGRRTWMYVDDQLPVEGLTPGAFTMLTLAQPLYLGGIPSSLYPPAAIAEKSNFVGCVQKMSISNQPIHLVSGAVSGTNIDSCDHPCSTHPCDNGGICEPQKENFSCRCPLGFNDPHCRSRVVTQVATPSFSGRSFLKYSDNEILKRFEREAHLSVDEKERAEIISPGDLVQLNVDSPLYLGGREAYRGFQTGYKTPGLNGCLADLILATDYHIDLITQASAGQNIDYC